MFPLSKTWLNGHRKGYRQGVYEKNVIKSYPRTDEAKDNIQGQDLNNCSLTIDHIRKVRLR